MKLVPFLLEQWLAKYRDSVAYHLGMSTGPKWTLAELRELMTGAEREAFDGAALTYTPSRGRDSLGLDMPAYGDALTILGEVLRSKSSFT